MKKRFLSCFIVLVLMVSFTTIALAYTPDENDIAIVYDKASNTADWTLCKVIFSGAEASKVDYGYGPEHGMTALTFPGTVKAKFYNPDGFYLYISKVGSESALFKSTATGYTEEVTLVAGKYNISFVADYGQYASGDAFTVTVGSRAYQEPKPLIATPTSSKVLINGKEVAFDAYNINDNNYFKLRDIAQAINGTEKQFDVSWDAGKNAITLLYSTAYTSVGGELAAGNGQQKTGTLCTSSIYIGDRAASLMAYTINGNNYFKLRDLGSAFDFGVSWVASSNMIAIKTDESYSPS